MTYYRLSIVKPTHGNEQRANAIMQELADTVRQQPGCTESTLLKADDGSGEIARISIYENARAASDAANSAHVMSLRSELHLIVEPGHVERAFETL